MSPSTLATRALRAALAFAVSLGVCLAAASGAPTGARAEERVEVAVGDGAVLYGSSRRGLVFAVDEPDFEARLGGRLHADAAFYDDDLTSIDDDAEIRRGRLYLSTRFLEDFRVKAEYEFASGRSGWRNLWFRWRPTRRTRIQGGNFVPGFGLESTASSNVATFMERALPAALGPGFQTGVGVHARGRLGSKRRHHHWTLASFVGAEPFGVEEDDRHRSEHVSWISRVTYAPLARRRRVVHLGASLEYRDNDGKSRYRIRRTPESALAPGLLNTGRLRDVDKVTTLGAEAAFMYKQFSVQGEYMQSWLTRTEGRADPTFYGGYVQGSWILTGEHRRYSRSRAVFGAVTPKRPWGAVELALRWSRLDLFDETVVGGRARNVTVGLNWWLRANVRVQLNYIDVRAKQRATRLDDEPKIFQMRFLVFF